MPGLESLKMLNAQSSWNDEQKGRSVSPLTSSDIAASIAHTSRDAQMYAYMKFVHDKSVMDELVYSLWIKMVDLANAKGWRVPRGKEYLRKMVRLAIIENVEPMRCTNCMGVGEKSRGPSQKVERCRGCGGSGMRTITEADRADIVGMDKSTWGRKWARRYQEVMFLIQDHELELERAIRYQLTDI